MPEIKYVNVSNPAAFGVEWTNGDNGNRFQLVSSRGTAGLYFGMLADGREEWSTTRVVDPERFGMTGPVKDFKAFMVIVRRYVEE